MLLIHTHGDVTIMSFDVTCTVEFNRLEFHSENGECWTINMTALEFSKFRDAVNNDTAGKHRK